MKKVLLPVMALLVLCVVAPVMAAPATKTPFTAEASFVPGNVYPGEEWITEDLIYHVKRQVGEGPVTGDIEGWSTIVRHATLDLKTGEGSCHGKIVITVVVDTVVVGTFEGTEQSTITAYGGTPETPGISGTFIAYGTDTYEGQKMMASFEGGLIGDTVVVVFKGIILSPKG